MSAPVDGTEPSPEGDDPTHDHEAAKFRKALRAAEAERDGLAATVERLRVREIEGIVSRDHAVAVPSAIWKLADVTPASLLDDDGEVDPAKVAEAVTTAIEALGLRVNRGLPQSPNAGREPQPGDKGPASWGDLLKAH